MTAMEMNTRELEQDAYVSTHAKGKSIIVATDGSESALAAFNAAKLISERNHAPVHVLSVLDPLPMLIPTPEGMLIPPDIDSSRRQGQNAIVRDQMRLFDPSGEWTMDLMLGRPAETIVEFAHEQDAGLIVIGTNKHGIWGRLLGEATALEISRLTDVPLLVASPDMKRLPHRIMVALDLNPEGLQSVPAALEMIAEAPSISCVHVKPRVGFMDVDWVDLDPEYEIALKERFAEFEKSLVNTRLRADLVVLHGDTTRELCAFTTYSKAELLIVGVRRRRGKARAVGGRMAARVLRQMETSVLIAPNMIPRERGVIEAAGRDTKTISDSKLFGEALVGFTSRNAGRMVTLEVDDPEFGALVEAVNYPLLGIDYDHRDDVFTIALGNVRNLDRHLSRSIVHPESISTLSQNGRDLAMSVKHGSGQTIITF